MMKTTAFLAVAALAADDPDRAIENADNLEYFAENTPALPTLGDDASGDRDGGVDGDGGDAPGDGDDAPGDGDDAPGDRDEGVDGDGDGPPLPPEVARLRFRNYKPRDPLLRTRTLVGWGRGGSAPLL